MTPHLIFNAMLKLISTTLPPPHVPMSTRAVQKFTSLNYHFHGYIPYFNNPQLSFSKPPTFTFTTLNLHFHNFQLSHLSTLTFTILTFTTLPSLHVYSSKSLSPLSTSRTTLPESPPRQRTCPGGWWLWMMIILRIKDLLILEYIFHDNILKIYLHLILFAIMFRYFLKYLLKIFRFF